MAFRHHDSLYNSLYTRAHAISVGDADVQQAVRQAGNVGRAVACDGGGRLPRAGGVPDSEVRPMHTGMSIARVPWLYIGIADCMSIARV